MNDTEPVYVEPLEFKLRLRLGRKRFLARIGDRLGDFPELREHLDGISKYIVRRLRRKYPALGVTKPIWSVNTDATYMTMVKYGYCRFDYVDLGPYSDEPVLVILPEVSKDVVVMPNRAQRRSK